MKIILSLALIPIYIVFSLFLPLKLKASSYDPCTQINKLEPKLLLKFNDTRTNSLARVKANFKSSLNTDFGFKIKAIKQLVPDTVSNSILARKSSTDKSNNEFSKLYKLELEETGEEYSCSDLKSYAQNLNSEPGIDFAVLDIHLKSRSSISRAVDDTYASEQWGLEDMDVAQVWENYQGKGITIAVVDTGVDYNHPDLWDNIWLNPNLVSDTNNDGEITLDDVDINHDHRISAREIIPGMFGNDHLYNPKSLDYHGTHVAGIIAAKGDNSQGVVGVAPKAKIMALGTGSFSASGVISAILTAAKYGAQVSNNSWGFYNANSGEYKKLFAEIKKAYNYASSKGMIHIGAAGNDGINPKKDYPIHFGGVLGVGAVNSQNRLAQYLNGSFSNYGNEIMVSAPGRNILSTYSDEDYQEESGCSMAAPHVAGLVALMLEAKPGLSFKQIKTTLQRTGNSVQTPLRFGKRVNAYNAFKYLNLIE